MMIEWKVKFGDKELKVTANDLVEMLERVIGREYYYHENNDRMKADVQMKVVHELDIQMLELLKSQFSNMIVEDGKKHVHMRVVKKNRDRSEVGHTFKGRAGDIVEAIDENLQNKKP